MQQSYTQFDSLLQACQENKLEDVERLIKDGADPHAQNSSGQSVVDIVTGLTEMPSKNKLNYALFENSKWGNIEKVKILLALGADVNVKDLNHHTPLHLACIDGHLPVVKELLKAGADIDAITSKDAGEFAPIQIACKYLHLHIVKELIKCGINPKYKKFLIDFITKDETEIKPGEDRLKAALIINSKKGNANRIRVFLAFGGDENQTDSSGFTLLHIASSLGHLEVVRELINSGANVNAQNQNQKTVKFAVINPSPEGSSSNIPTSLAFSPFGTEPLHLACANGHLEIVKELINAGANVNAKSSESLHEATSLHLASANGHLEIVKELIDAGADVNAKSSENSGKIIPLDIAIKNKNSEIAYFLTKTYLGERSASPSSSPFIDNQISSKVANEEQFESRY